MSQQSYDIKKKILLHEANYLHVQDLGPALCVLKTLLPQETKEGTKTVLSQSAE